jgi:hypothetical protein
MLPPLHLINEIGGEVAVVLGFEITRFPPALLYFFSSVIVP